jgi:hypothetical protein
LILTALLVRRPIRLIAASGRRLMFAAMRLTNVIAGGHRAMDRAR